MLESWGLHSGKDTKDSGDACAAGAFEPSCGPAWDKVLEPRTMDMPVDTLFRSVEEVLVRLPLLMEVLADDQGPGATEYESSLPSTSIPHCWLICALHCPEVATGIPLDSTFSLPLTQDYGKSSGTVIGLSMY